MAIIGDVKECFKFRICCLISKPECVICDCGQNCVVFHSL